MLAWVFRPAEAALLAIGLLAGGCGPSQDQISLAKAMSARTDNHPTYNESARLLNGRVAPHDKDYVMWSMDYVSLCLMGGNYDAAKAELMKCSGDIRGRKDTDKETAAALGNEAAKIFKGEPFERAMVCTYLGMLYYMAGDYNNARIFSAQADMEDATTEEDMKDYRHDFQVAHYWLGRAFLKLGQEDNARIAFQKASTFLPRKNEDQERKALQDASAAARERTVRLEKESFRLATTGKPPVAGAADMSNCCAVSELPAVLGAQTGENPVLQAAQSPQQFFDVGYQKEVNLILMIETGIGPIKYLVGENGCMDAIIRAPYPERNVMVYLNGHKAGSAIRVLDVFHQADTRGSSEKDRIQLAKGVTQSILSRIPYVGYVAGYWDVRADDRYWHLMPGEVHVFAAKVKPGIYTVCLQCTDINGNLLPRYRVTRYYLPVREGQESVYLLHSYPEADNQYAAPKN
jgi:tetratricopeptide (TPR) repeat protein